MNSVEADIRAFLSKYIAVKTVASNANLFEAGFMSSLFAVQLLTFIETHFHICIPDEELELRNFATILAMSNLIERLQSTSRTLA